MDYVEIQNNISAYLKQVISCLNTTIAQSNCSFELDLIHIIDEVRKAHEGRWPFVLRQIRADSAWIAASTSVKKDTEMIVVDVLWLATNFSQELLHVNR